MAASFLKLCSKTLQALNVLGVVDKSNKKVWPVSGDDNLLFCYDRYCLKVKEDFCHQIAWLYLHLSDNMNLFVTQK